MIIQNKLFLSHICPLFMLTADAEYADSEFSTLHPGPKAILGHWIGMGVITVMCHGRIEMACAGED